MVKVGKCALISLMHKKWTLRVELTKKKLATVRVGISSKTPTKNNCLNSNTLNMEISGNMEKLKIEKKISEFFLNFFSKFPVSRIVPKNVKGGAFYLMLDALDALKMK